MADDLAAYKSQLQQVEAALTTDPDNEELLKLKTDLQEVLELTKELVSQQQSSTAAPSSSSTTDQNDWAATADAPEIPAAPTWNVGDRCNSYYAEDGGMYEAKIDEILEDGTCTITYEGYDITEVTQLAFLQPLEDKKSGDDDGEPKAKKMKKKDLQAAQREYKRKKNQKKAQRQKQMEEEREQEKNKWLSFNHKVINKTGKGRVKKSIFATPESASGRVGVGTCGMSGKPMTEYSHQQKWKK